MPRFLLDTNILSDLVAWPAGVVAVRIASLSSQQRANLCTSTIVAAEMRYGAAKRNSPRLSTRIDLILTTLEVLPFEPDADRIYGMIRSHLERNGTPIGPNDMLIAAHALSADCTLVTDNEREFRRVPGLRLENWLRPRS